jgi:hypothetical protein
VNRRKTATDHGQQFEAGHTRHIEIGNDDIGNVSPDLGQCGEAVGSSPHAVSEFVQDGGESQPNRYFVVNDKEFCLGIGHRAPLRIITSVEVGGLTASSSRGNLDVGQYCSNRRFIKGTCFQRPTGSHTTIAVTSRDIWPLACSVNQGGDLTNIGSGFLNIPC